MLASRLDIRRAADRFVTRTGWLDSRHSFSHGAHYDPDNTHFGLLLAHNADVVAAGHGFDPHPHRDVEIVTWVLDGTVAHADDAGRTGRARPGIVQRLSAGSGVRHSEHATADADARLVQMWVLPDGGGGKPDYARRDVTAELDTGRLVVVASGMPHHVDVLTLRQGHAALHAGRLPAGAVEALPVAAFVHVYVAHGSTELDDARLGPGDAARITATEGLHLTAGPDGAEVLVWEMHAGPEYAPDDEVDGRPRR